MTVKTNETKARLMRTAFGKVAGEYLTEGNRKDATKIIQAAEAMDNETEMLAKLYDLITSD